MSYYSVYDTDTNNYLATGSNSKTKHDALTAVFDYCMNDSELTKKEREQVSKSDKEMEGYLGGMGFRIEKHREKINCDLW